MDGGVAAAGDNRPPILVKINQKLRQTPVADSDQAVARKHVCRGVWCSCGCYKRLHLERHFARLSEIPREEARFVTLTLDRKIVGEGASAYIWSREAKAISYFIKNLKRKGVVVNDWCGQMEFHKDGTPHWHLLIRTKRGQAGMIGGDRLRSVWPWGAVYEEYFSTQNQYDKTVGYFGKAGYFHKGKKYQTELPDYFQSDYFKGKRIMRFYSARRPSGEERPEPSEKEPEKSETITALKLKTCGQFTHIWYFREDEAGFACGEVGYSQCLNIPYKEFVDQFPGEYVPGFGYAFWLSGTPPEVEPCPF